MTKTSWRSPTAPNSACLRVSCTNDLRRAIAYIDGLDVGTCNIWEQPGYRIEMSPFGGIKDSGNAVKEGVLEAMKFFTNVKTYSLPWPR